MLVLPPTCKEVQISLDLKFLLLSKCLQIIYRTIYLDKMLSSVKIKLSLDMLYSSESTFCSNINHMQTQAQIFQRCHTEMFVKFWWFQNFFQILNLQLEYHGQKKIMTDTPARHIDGARIKGWEKSVQHSIYFLFFYWN